MSRSLAEPFDGTHNTRAEVKEANISYVKAVNHDAASNGFDLRRFSFEYDWKDRTTHEAQETHCQSGLSASGEH